MIIAFPDFHDKGHRALPPGPLLGSAKKRSFVAAQNAAREKNRDTQLWEQDDGD
jgi:hypothetical protein